MSDESQRPSGEERRAQGLGAEQEGLGDREMSRLHDQLLREKKEPNELMRPMPLWLVTLSGLVVAWAAFYFGTKYAGFSAEVFDPNYEGGQVTVQAEEPAFDPIAHGERIFRNNCVACHQADGQGLPGAFPPLVEVDWVQGNPDRSIHILLAGMNGPIEVNGQAYNGNMPAFGGILSDRDIAAVLSYIRVEWNGSEVVPEDRVADLRASAPRSAPWTGEEILADYPLP